MRATTIRPVRAARRRSERATEGGHRPTSEEHDRIGDNTHAVATGLEKTGRLITAAAAILAINFAAFGTAGMSFVKLIGMGLALAIVMDVTVIRGPLVPAFMRLAGEANWWRRGRSSGYLAGTGPFPRPRPHPRHRRPVHDRPRRHGRRLGRMGRPDRRHLARRPKRS